MRLAAQDRIEIRKLLNQGRTREQVIQYFIKKYGSEVALASPIDRASTGWRGRSLTASAWSRPAGSATARTGCAKRRVGRGGGARRDDDPELSDKLEDELPNLD